MLTSVFMSQMYKDEAGIFGASATTQWTNKLNEIFYQHGFHWDNGHPKQNTFENLLPWIDTTTNVEKHINNLRVFPPELTAYIKDAKEASKNLEDPEKSIKFAEHLLIALSAYLSDHSKPTFGPLMFDAVYNLREWLNRDVLRAYKLDVAAIEKTEYEEQKLERASVESVIYSALPIIKGAIGVSAEASVGASVSVAGYSIGLKTAVEVDMTVFGVDLRFVCLLIPRWRSLCTETFLVCALFTEILL